VSERERERESVCVLMCLPSSSAKCLLLTRSSRYFTRINCKVARSVVNERDESAVLVILVSEWLAALEGRAKSGI